MLIHDIRGHGDVPIPGGFHGQLNFDLRSVQIYINSWSEPPDPVLTYNDSVVILEAFRLKMSREGFFERSGEIEQTLALPRLGKVSIEAYV